MMLAIIALYFKHGAITGVYTFDILQIASVTYPAEFQIFVFLAFFLGFAIKVPMFPFHTWLPDAHVEAPTAGSVILAGVLLKMGTYGFLRFCLPITPLASIKFVPLIATLSVIESYRRHSKYQKTCGLFFSQSHGICYIGNLCL